MPALIPSPKKSSPLLFVVSSCRVKIIYFSVDKAELRITWAAQKGAPWSDMVVRQILHEKGHLAWRGYLHRSRASGLRL